jgi:hypothetical protein
MKWARYVTSRVQTRNILQQKISEIYNALHDGSGDLASQTQ